MDETRGELARLQAEIESLRERLAEVDSRLTMLAQAAQEPAAPPPPIRPGTPPELVKDAAPHAPPAALEAPSEGIAPPTQRDVEAKLAKPALSLEQRVGASWLNKIGIVVLILAAAFFFQYAVQRGWISPTIRVLLVAAVGLILLALGEWTLRKAMRIFAAGATGGGIAFLYAAGFATSPKIYGLLSTPTTFVLMCVVTAVGVALSLRSGMLTTAVLVQIGAYLTPLLLSTGRDEQVFLMTYLMVVGAGFLVLSALKRWHLLPLIAAVGTIVLFAGWYERYYDALENAMLTAVFGWALFAIFVLFAAIATAWRRAHEYVGIAVCSVAGACMGLLLLGQCNAFSGHALMGQLFAVDLAILSVCLLRRWCWLRIGALGWTALVVVALSGETLFASDLVQCGWIWAFYGLFALDVFVRAFWASRRSVEKLDSCLAAAATAAMFWGTYGVLKDQYANWMGLYTAGLAGGAFLLALVAAKLARRRYVAWGYVAQGLVLVTLAVPIQFDKATVTIAWAAQGAVTMLLARRLRSKLLLVKSPLVLFLAILHFLWFEIREDPGLREVMFTIGGVDVVYLLAVAAAVAASAFVSAALLRAGGAIYNRRDEQSLSAMLVWTGAILWAAMTWWLLPDVAATWWWLVPFAGIAAVAVWRRSKWLASSGALLLAGVALKFLLRDTLYRLYEGSWGADLNVVLNWSFASALAVAAALFLFGMGLTRRLSDRVEVRVAVVAVILLASLLVIWAGSFEIHRYFEDTTVQLSVEAGQAEQMACSIWWAAYATGLLIIGFAARYAPIRYMALVIFAVTIGKVLLVDMAGIEAGYRIASFMALGGLLVAASLLYQRYFREALANWDKARR